MGFFRYIADYFKRDAAAPSNQGAAAPAGGSNNAGVLTPRQGGVLWPTYAGQTALCVATVYRCVKFIAESVANLNLQCMRLRDGIYVDEKDSRLSYLLNVQPDLALSAFDMWVTAVAYALLKGNAYIVPVYSPITMDIDRFALCGAGTVTHDTYNDTYHVCDVENGIYSVFPDFSQGLQLGGLSKTAFKFDFAWAGEHIIQFIAIVFAFLYVDLFDTVGTVVGIADKANLLDKDGKLPRVGRVLMSDAIGTTVGACLGTSTITSFVESSSGVAAGGRTGLTAATTGVMFILALFLSPIFLAIPSFATAPALLYVGMLMVSSAKKISFDGDTADVAGAYMAMLMMPLTYSIANGIMFGIITWVVLRVFEGKAKTVGPVMWVVFALFVLRIITLITNFQ